MVLAQWQFYNVLEKALPARMEKFLITFLNSRGMNYEPGENWERESARLADSCFVRDQQAAKAIQMFLVFQWEPGQRKTA